MPGSFHSSLFYGLLNLAENSIVRQCRRSAIRLQIKMFGLLNADLVLRFDEELLSFKSNDLISCLSLSLSRFLLTGTLSRSFSIGCFEREANIVEITSRTHGLCLEKSNSFRRAALLPSREDQEHEHEHEIQLKAINLKRPQFEQFQAWA